MPVFLSITVYPNNISNAWNTVLMPINPKTAPLSAHEYPDTKNGEKNIAFINQMKNYNIFIMYYTTSYSICIYIIYCFISAFEL